MSDLRLLVVPGGTSPASVAMAHASLHKLVELYEEREVDPNHPAPRTVVVIRDPAQVPPSSLRAAATTPREAFPPALYPEPASTTPISLTESILSSPLQDPLANPN